MKTVCFFASFILAITLKCGLGLYMQQVCPAKLTNRWACKYNRCYYDNDCNYGYKCCKSYCGRVCQYACQPVWNCNCPYGSVGDYYVNDYGCKACRCISQDQNQDQDQDGNNCPYRKCKYCEFGYQYDENGCQTCRCKWYNSNNYDQQGYSQQAAFSNSQQPINNNNQQSSQPQSTTTAYV